jgi:hypothetical protein
VMVPVGEVAAAVSVVLVLELMVTLAGCVVNVGAAFTVTDFAADCVPQPLALKTVTV